MTPAPAGFQSAKLTQPAERVRADPAPARGFSPPAYRTGEVLAVRGTAFLVGDGTGVGMPVATGVGEPAGAHGAGAGAAFPPVGTGTGVAVHAADVGTAVGGATVGTGVAVEAPAGAATGTAVALPLPDAVGEAVGVPVPAPGVCAIAGIPLGASVAGLLAVTLAGFAGLDAAGVTEQPARARPAAIPSVQPTATLDPLLCERTVAPSL